KGKKIYYAGDTGLSTDMKLLRDDGIDIAILPIGGNYTMDIDDAVKAVKLIEPKLTIPMHYNTFPLIKADPLEFKKKNIYSDTKVLEIGESYSF
ncbi:metal-dependent hydrolase, partial [Vibrio parahaemolyticus]|nr:metal-dependent hydrolase [Vibrio parahaemolyticus]